MDWNNINEFCKVKARPARENGSEELPARVKWIVEKLEADGIDYEIESFPAPLPDYSFNFKFWKDKEKKEEKKPNMLHNVVMKGTSDKMVVAHHDIVNPDSDNANDNSASVINAIMTKKLRPQTNVVILDGEEGPYLGEGSRHCAERVKKGDFGNIKWVLNLELTGSGGETFFIGRTHDKSELGESIKEIFECPIMSAPFNDSFSFIAEGIDSININPLPVTEERTSLMHKGQYLKVNMLYNCHSMRDSLSTISPTDMKDFTEKVICRIIDEC